MILLLQSAFTSKLVNTSFRFYYNIIDILSNNRFSRKVSIEHLFYYKLTSAVHMYKFGHILFISSSFYWKYLYKKRKLSGLPTTTFFSATYVYYNLIIHYLVTHRTIRRVFFIYNISNHLISSCAGKTTCHTTK